MRIFRRAMILGLLTGLVGTIFILTPLGVIQEEELGLASLYALRGSVPAPQEVVIVSIDKQSALLLNQPLKIRNWSRSLHAELIRKLVERGASVIVFDVFFDEIRAADTDSQLAKEIENAERVVLVERLERTHLGDITVDWLKQPVSSFVSAAAGLAPFPLPKIRDRVNQFWAFYPMPLNVRTPYPAAKNAPTLPVVALQLYVVRSFGYEKFVTLLAKSGFRGIEELPQSVNHSKDLLRLMDSLRTELRSNTALLERYLANLNEPGDQQHPTSAWERRMLSALAKTYHGFEHRFLNFYGEPGSIASIPYRVFWQEKEAPDAGGLPELKDKIIFVGNMELSFTEEHDGFSTVFSRADGVDISGVEIAATAFANLLDDRTLNPTRGLFNPVIVFVFGCLAGFLAYRIAGVRAVPVVFVLGLLYVGLALLLFVKQNVWIPVVTPLVVELPFALVFGFLWQYLGARRAREKYSKAMRFYVPERVIQNVETGGHPSTRPEVVYGTCMSTDVAGYTTLAETMLPEELAAITSEYFGLLGNRVEARKGEMLEIRGDGMNCLWAGRHSDTDTRLRACLAACEIAEAIKQFSQQHPDTPFPTRIGLHAGNVALGNVGGGGHYVYSVIGDIMNTAARIQNLNKALHTTLLASEPVINGLDDLLVRRSGYFILKGKAEKLLIFEIIGSRGMATETDKRLCETFSAALSAFEAADWSKADKMFQAVLTIQPTDGPAQFYLERCQRYRHSPPSTNMPSAIRIEAK